MCVYVCVYVCMYVYIYIYKSFNNLILSYNCIDSLALDWLV